MKQKTICHRCRYAYGASLENNDVYICSHPETPGRAVPANVATYWCPNMTPIRIPEVKLPKAETVEPEIKKDRFALVDMR
jgi:hypothetical protein